MTNEILRGKPDAGNPHVRFDEGEVASEKPRRGSLLYKIGLLLSVAFVARMAVAGAYVLNIDATTPNALTAARERIRELRADGTIAVGTPVEIVLAPGTYVQTEPLVLSASDSGSLSAPVVWRAESRGTVRVSRGRTLPFSSFVAATDAGVLNRLPAEARANVLAADISADVPQGGFEGWKGQSLTMPFPILTLNGRFEDVARWPNRSPEADSGWATFTEFADQGEGPTDYAWLKTMENRAERWNFEKGVWLFGYWLMDWRDEFVKAASWNPSTKILTFGAKFKWGVRKPNKTDTMRYFAVNLPEELDAPGEYWVDYEGSLLYYYPSAEAATGELVLLAHGGELVRVGESAHDITFRNFGFEHADQALVSGADVRRIRLESCDFRALRLDAVSLDGSDNVVVDCLFRQIGQRCVMLKGGDRKALRLARNVVERCDMGEYARFWRCYTPAVRVDGCGNAVRSCAIHDAPHQAIAFEGNEHLLAWNNVSNVVNETSDSGVFYTYGDGNKQHPTSLLSEGNKILGNRFEDIRRIDTYAVYFDGCGWGGDVLANVFERVTAVVELSGCLHAFAGNEVRGCKLGYFAFNGVSYMGLTAEQLRETFALCLPDRCPWSAAYPELIPTLDANPTHPCSNSIVQNLFVDCVDFTSFGNPTKFAWHRTTTEGFDIRGNVTVSTDGSTADAGIEGFAYYANRPADVSMVPGLADIKARAAALADAPTATVTSPDGRVTATFGLDVTGRLCCRATRDGEPLVGPSSMGVTVDGVDYGTLVRPDAATVTDVLAGKAVDAASAEGYADVTIPLERMLDGDRSATLEARVFDNGVAWRMRVAGSGPRHVAGGVALWDVADGNCTAMSAVDEPFEAVDEVMTGWSVAVLRPASVVDKVLTVDVPDGETRALSQSEVAVLIDDAVTNVVKAGGGTLRLDRDLTGYTGSWNVSSGQVQVCVGKGGFGCAGDAPVHLDVAQTVAEAPCLTFLASGTVERPIEFVRTPSGDRSVLAVGEGVDVRLLRTVRNVEATSTGGVAYFTLNAGSTLTFAGGCTNRMSLAGFRGTGAVEFRDVPSSLRYCYVTGTVRVRFSTPSNNVSRVVVANNGTDRGFVELACADALAGSASVVIANVRNATVDLAGHNLTCANLELSDQSTYTGGELTSASPATLDFYQGVAKTNLACAISGALSLVKRGAEEFAVACPLTATGSLTVKQGAFRFLPTGSWTSVASVNVGASGTLILENPQAFNANRTTLSITDAAARVLVADGMSLPVAGITYLDSPLDAGKTYGGPESDADVKLDVFGTGTGVVRIYQPGTYTWSGAAGDGDWKNPVNWGRTLLGDVPVAGDTAVFNADATITSDIALGGATDADVLTLQIAEGKTLTVNASISGTGGVMRQGDGALKLMKANPFTGTYVSVPTDAQTKGHTYVYDAGALGTSSADFNPSSGCAAVHFDAVNAPDGTLAFDIPIRLPTGSTSVSSYTVYFANGKIVFNESVTSSGRMTVSVSNATEVRFKEKLTAGGWLDMGGFPKTCHFYYEKGVSTTGIWYHSRSSASHHVWTSDNKFYFASADSYGGMGSITLVCEDEDVIKNCTSLVSFGWRNGDSGTAYVDLKGHDQHYPAFASGCILKTSDFGFTSSEGLPAANVILAGNYKNNLAFNGQFKGRAGLTWSPTNGEREFLLSNVVSSTKGSLKVLNGVLRLAGGTSFSALSTLEVGATGCLTLDADAGAQTEANEVVVAEGGELAIPVGKTVRCRIASYKGEPIADGTYPQDGSLDFLPGEGTFIVDSSVQWSGTASGAWDEPTNWKSGEVPSAGQKVRIAGDVQVSLSGTTAQMSKLSLAEGATLVMTDWNAVLKADDVCVGDGATITTDGPFATADDAPASRVHIVCGTLTVDEGGKIDVKAKGWQGGVYNSGNVYGYGPGSPRNGSKYGAAHGGFGAVGVHGGPGPGRVPFGVPYDDPHAPVLPGSGAGSNSSSYPGTSGGGAVLIEATGAVVVNGAIDASAGDATAVTRMNLTSEKCGSGGSVWIKSATVSGAGSILANGGNGDTGGGSPTFYWSYFDASGSKGGPYAGGGGMIRIEYGAGQTAVTDNALVVSAACGYYAGLADGSWRMPAAWHDKYRSEADLGTLTFTDTTLVDQLLGKGLAGRLVDVREYTYEGDLVWTSGHVRFAAEGVDVRFTGNLTVSNDVSRLEIGGIETGTNRSMYVDRYAGKLFNKLSVDGDLKLLNGSALDIRAAEKSATQAWGGEVSVGKDFTVGAGSYLYPWCDVLNTGAPHFTVGGAFTLEEGATVMADRRGGAPGHAAGNATAGLNAYFGFSRSNGYGTGAGTGGAGAGHGGVGGRGVNGTALSGTAGTAVDDEWEPMLPGAGGGSSGYGEGGEGGGLFHLVAQGPVVVDGTITANGFMGTYSGAAYGHYFGSGAGGGVFLAGASFTGGASARISAQGGHAISIEDADGKQHASGCGAGGRVAIAVGMDQKTGPRPRAVKSESAEAPEIAELFSFAGVIDVGGGTNIWGTAGKMVAPAQVEQSLGGDGTVRYLRWMPTPGVLLFVR